MDDEQAAALVKALWAIEDQLGKIADNLDALNQKLAETKEAWDQEAE